MRKETELDWKKNIQKKESNHIDQKKLRKVHIASKLVTFQINRSLVFYRALEGNGCEWNYKWIYLLKDPKIGQILISRITKLKVMHEFLKECFQYQKLIELMKVITIGMNSHKISSRKLWQNEGEKGLGNRRRGTWKNKINNRNLWKTERRGERVKVIGI